MDDRKTNPEPPFSWAAMESRSGESPPVGRIDLSGSGREVIRQEIAAALRVVSSFFRGPFGFAFRAAADEIETRRDR